MRFGRVMKSRRPQAWREKIEAGAAALLRPGPLGHTQAVRASTKCLQTEVSTV